MVQCSLQHLLVRQKVLLKPVEERWRDILQLGFLHHHYTLKLGVHTARFDVGPNGNVGVVPWARGGIDAVEAAVEEVIEALVNSIGLGHHHSMAFCGRVANSSDGVDLKGRDTGKCNAN